MKNNMAGIITGASSGIGKSLALLLAKKYKAQLVLNGRSVSALEETAELVIRSGGKAVLVPGDIAQEKLASDIVDKCLESFGTADLLVNNAGLAKPGKLLSLTTEDWQNVFAVNFFAPLNATYKVLPYMVKNKGGKIVNIASVAGKIAFPGSVCYAASKFALTGFSEGLAAELADKNIDVITVCPGWVRTEFFAKNKMSTNNNPTEIANQSNLRGWLMRNVLSISSNDCAKHIMDTLEKGGSHEIVLTLPGIMAERINAFFPGVMGKLVGRFI